MTLKHLLRWLLRLAAVIAFAAFAALAIGVWAVSAEVRTRSDKLLAEADKTLNRAEPVTKAIREGLDAASAELKAAKPATPTPAIPEVPKMLLRSAIQSAPGKVEAASHALDSLNGLLMLARVSLEAFQGAPGVPPVEADKLASLQSKVAASNDALSKADAIFRAAAGNKADSFAAEDVTKLENALGEASSAVAEVEARLNTARGQVSTLQGTLPSRITLVTWAIFLLAFFGAIGQIAIFLLAGRASDGASR